MKKLLFALAPATLMAGCAREQALPGNAGEGEAGVIQSLTADEVKFMAGRSMPVKFDEQEVDRIVGDAIGFLEMTSPATRSARRTVSKITPISGSIGDPATRAEGEQIEEELFYAVDFANEEGFALIAADRRLPDEVLINVGHGSFPEDEIDNPGLALMMVGAENYARREIARHEAWQDSVEMALLARFEGGDSDLAESITADLASPDDPGSETRAGGEIISTTYQYGPWSTKERIAPMIPV